MKNLTLSRKNYTFINFTLKKFIYKNIYHQKNSSPPRFTTAIFCSRILSANFSTNGPSDDQKLYSIFTCFSATKKQSNLNTRGKKSQITNLEPLQEGDLNHEYESKITGFESSAMGANPQKKRDRITNTLCQKKFESHF